MRLLRIGLEPELATTTEPQNQWLRRRLSDTGVPLSDVSRGVPPVRVLDERTGEVINVAMEPTDDEQRAALSELIDACRTSCEPARRVRCGAGSRVEHHALLW